MDVPVAGPDPRPVAPRPGRGSITLVQDAPDRWHAEWIDEDRGARFTGSRDEVAVRVQVQVPQHAVVLAPDGQRRPSTEWMGDVRAAWHRARPAPEDDPGAVAAQMW
ncbi:hypothetical protein [Kineococcus sp. SYSU DK004]|uniref:hypothetical protein n=1 Tax=Kineococcus sp. SYSU DK004 TaxID=3383125 RepID=UPI003D7C5E2D